MQFGRILTVVFAGMLVSEVNGAGPTFAITSDVSLATRDSAAALTALLAWRSER